MSIESEDELYKKPLEVLSRNESKEKYGIRRTKTLRFDHLLLSEVKSERKFEYIRKVAVNDDNSDEEEVEKVKKQFPRVFVRDASGKCKFKKMRFGTDIFKVAGIRKNISPEIVVEELNGGDVIIRSPDTELTQEIREQEYIRYTDLKEKENKDKSQEEIEKEELLNFKLESTEYKVPAGAFTMRADSLGYVSRLLLNVSRIGTKNAAPVRLASVVLPIIKFKQSGRKYLLISQRQKRKKGVYNNIWVFPGGHVDKNENLKQAAVREAYEEIGLNIKEENLSPLCCWQEFYLPKQLQYMIMVFSTEIEVEEEFGEVEYISTIGIQLKEVQSIVLLPDETWDHLIRKDEKSTKYEKVLGVKAQNETVETSEFDVKDIEIRGPHLFAAAKLINKLRALDV